MASIDMSVMTEDRDLEMCKSFNLKKRALRAEYCIVGIPRNTAVSFRIILVLSFCCVQIIFPTADRPMYHSLEQLFVHSLSEDVRKSIDQLYLKGEKFYEGYCDDPRNTDNAWLEIVACNYHDYNNVLSHGTDEVLLHCIFMVALCNRADHYIFMLWFVLLSSFFFLLFFSSPNLSGRRLDVYHTLAHGVALVRI